MLLKGLEWRDPEVMEVLRWVLKKLRGSWRGKVGWVDDLEKARFQLKRLR